MSSWDAPTGNWGSRQEPDESGRPDEQDYRQGESTGGYGTMRGDEGRLRTGRRGLPGYEQAQNHDQGTAGYDQGHRQEGARPHGRTSSAPPRARPTSFWGGAGLMEMIFMSVNLPN